jgi:predicted transposase/invertase (TIGR01784 family)
MKIHVLNLERLPIDEDSKLADWLRFIGAETEEEIKMAAVKDPVINEAYCKLQVMSEVEENRMIYEARLKAQRDEYSRIQGARREGREEGREEGRRERLGIAAKMKKRGVPIDQIAEDTGFSPEEIAVL